MGLCDADLSALASVGTVRAVSAGQPVVAANDVLGGSGVVLTGALEVQVGAPLPSGIVNKGECVDLSAAGACALIAREPTTLMVVTPPAFELLPPATQRTLARLTASGAARRFSALAAAHGESAQRTARLASHVKEFSGRSRRLLAAPALRDALSEIPALPIHAADLTFKLCDERTHADEIVTSIQNDPALAGLVLKRVNSAYYGLAMPVSDHYHALLLLGTHTVSQLVLETAVTSVIPDGPLAHDIQTRAHLTSVLAYEIALLSQAVTPLVASTIGLLHNIGDSVALMIREARPDAAPLIDCLDSSALGAAVLASWGVPEPVHEVVAGQSVSAVLRPDELDAYPAESSVLALARACHDALVDDVPAPDHAGQYLAYLGLGASGWDRFCHETIGAALVKRADRLPALARARLQRAPAGMITTP